MRYSCLVAPLARCVCLLPVWAGLCFSQFLCSQPVAAVPQQGTQPLPAQKYAAARESRFKRLAARPDNNFSAEDVEFLSQYCQDWSGGGHQDESRAIMQRVLKSPNVSAHAYCSMATTYLNEVEEESELQAARKYLAMALKKDPGFSQAYYRLALVEQRSEHPAEALRQVEKALSMKDPFLPAWGTKAALLSSMGHVKEAYQTVCYAEKVIPDDYATLCTKAGILQQMGKPYEAALTYKRVYTNLYKSDYLMHLIVNCLYQSGHYEEALEELKTLIKITPGDSDNYRMRASILAKYKRFGEALKDINHALELEPSSIAYKERAKIYEQMGKPDKARADLQAAAKLVE